MGIMFFVAHCLHLRVVAFIWGHFRRFALGHHGFARVVLRRLDVRRRRHVDRNSASKKWRPHLNAAHTTRAHRKTVHQISTSVRQKGSHVVHLANSYLLHNVPGLGTQMFVQSLLEETWPSTVRWVNDRFYGAESEFRHLDEELLGDLHRIFGLCVVLHHLALAQWGDQVPLRASARRNPVVHSELQ